jgi:hypothetical protein
MATGLDCVPDRHRSDGQVDELEIKILESWDKKRNPDGLCVAFFLVYSRILALKTRAGPWTSLDTGRARCSDPVTGILGVRKVELMLRYFYDRNQSSMDPSNLFLITGSYGNVLSA